MLSIFKPKPKEPETIPALTKEQERSILNIKLYYSTASPRERDQIRQFLSLIYDDKIDPDDLTINGEYLLHYAEHNQKEGLTQ